MDITRHLITRHWVTLRRLRPMSAPSGVTVLRRPIMLRPRWPAVPSTTIIIILHSPPLLSLNFFPLRIPPSAATVTVPLMLAFGFSFGLNFLQPFGSWRRRTRAMRRRRRRIRWTSWRFLLVSRRRRDAAVAPVMASGGRMTAHGC